MMLNWTYGILGTVRWSEEVCPAIGLGSKYQIVMAFKGYIQQNKRPSGDGITIIEGVGNDE